MESTEPKFVQTGGRRDERTALDATVQFRAGARKALVKVLDLTLHGAKLSAVHLVHAGDCFFLKLGTLEPLEARVVWSTTFEIGCEFVTPLHPVILERLTKD